MGFDNAIGGVIGSFGRLGYCGRYGGLGHGVYWMVGSWWGSREMMRSCGGHEGEAWKVIIGLHSKGSFLLTMNGIIW